MCTCVYFLMQRVSMMVTAVSPPFLARGISLGLIQSHYIYCMLYFYYYHISSTSDHQALDVRGWGPLVNKIG